MRKPQRQAPSSMRSAFGVHVFIAFIALGDLIGLAENTRNQDMPVFESNGHPSFADLIIIYEKRRHAAPYRL